VNPRTVVRGGYGVYWAPWNYQFVGAANYGQIGYSQNTFINQGQFSPTVTLENPFPGGLLPIVGNAAGPLTGVGSNIEFIDQNKRAPYVQQYSFDINRELPGNIASSTRARRAAASASAARTTRRSTSTSSTRSSSRSAPR
jgi:hypothetical protein